MTQIKNAITNQVLYLNYMENNTISLKEYLYKIGNSGKFIIPTYQRGYIWGQENVKYKGSSNSNSAEKMIVDLLNGYHQEKKEIFLQGITVWEDGENITLVDGQQRTTFFYLLLKYLNFEGYMKLYYAVREKSNEFLKNLDIESVVASGLNEDEEYQDVYFFKKTLLIVHDKIQREDINDFRDYILSKVKFLYIPIDKEKATIVFSMMNGNKACMLSEELIKSELLRCASLSTEDSLISEAENVIIRGRLAREWDAWLYWWNDNDRQIFFRLKDPKRNDAVPPLGWLIPLLSKKDNITFDEFRNKFLITTTVKTAKTIFKQMRLLQKSIEDAYNNAKTYNQIGAILQFLDSREKRYRFLNWYFDQVTKAKINSIELEKKLSKYYDLSMLGISHEDILNNNKQKIKEAIDDFNSKLEDDLLYKNNKDIAARWLLRLNIYEDCNQKSGEGRPFDFEIWREKTLEHILPKSKVFHVKDGVILDWDDKVVEPEAFENFQNPIMREADPANENDCYTSEHSIGNLVLLYGNDNSKLKADDFEPKKKKFFDNIGDSVFRSRHLIHTISVFSSSQWGKKEIAEHKKQEILKFNKQYEKYVSETI